VSLNPTLNPHTKKPYSRGTQPYVIHRWLDGYSEPGTCRPKSHLPWYGIMQDPDVASIHFKDDKLFSFGHFVARRGRGATIEVSMLVPDGAVAMVARRVVRCCQRRGMKAVPIGPNGTPAQAADMTLKAIEKMLRRRHKTNEYTLRWRLQQAAQEVSRVAAAREIDSDRIEQVVLAMRACVTQHRMKGWSEQSCKTTLDEIDRIVAALPRRLQAVAA
jgi:hypothetical protein